MKVCISKTDQIPFVCAVCGGAAQRSVVQTYASNLLTVDGLKLLARSYFLLLAPFALAAVSGPEGWMEGAMIAFLLLIATFVASLFVIHRIIKRLNPSIQRKLPFCASHAPLMALLERLRTWQLVVAVVVYFTGLCMFVNTELSWILLASTAIAAVLVLLTHDFFLNPSRVDDHIVTLLGVHREFAVQFEKLNVLGMRDALSLPDVKTRESDLFVVDPDFEDRQDWLPKIEL